MIRSSAPIEELALPQATLHLLQERGCSAVRDALEIMPWQLSHAHGAALANAFERAGLFSISYWARLAPQPVSRAGVPRKTILLAFSDDDGPVSRVGGRPSSGGEAVDAPFVLQLVADAELDLGPHAAIQVFRGGEDHLAIACARLGPVRPVKDPYPGFAISLRSENDPELLLDRTTALRDEAAYWRAVNESDVSKIGGVPTSPVLPRLAPCSECSAELEYFAQFAPGSTPDRDGRGRLVVFACPSKHRFAAKMV